MMPSLILASGSSARREMLKKAGVSVAISAANIDENAIIENEKEVGTEHNNIALKLSAEKAKTVSKDYTGQYIIGADQLLIFNNQIFSKSKTLEAAKEKLQMMRGKTHQLISAVSLIRDEKIIWQESDQAHLTFRDFSDDEINRYLEKASEDALSCVGGYAIEGRGIQLFDKIEGDFFTILGMPLLPLLGALREARAI